METEMVCLHSGASKLKCLSGVPVESDPEFDEAANHATP